MVSQEKNEANRRNAKRSTGPRTAAGKETSSRNSRRHGIASGVLKDPIWAYEVHKLAKIFLGKGVEPRYERAIMTVLAAMVDVMRVQAARMEVWNASLMRHSLLEPQGVSVSEATTVDADALVAAEVLPQLVKLERYERRARAYCRYVIRKLGDGVEEPRFLLT